MKNTSHGMSRHRIYPTWVNMINRCNNPLHKFYSYYGGRGIKVCERWLKVENFIEDMYPSFKEGLSIDRINTNDNYCKENCRWSSKSTQTQNTRKIRISNTSGYRGVSFDKEKNKFRVSIRVNGKSKNLGRYKTDIEAAYAYDEYITKNNLEHTKNFS